MASQLTEVSMNLANDCPWLLGLGVTLAAFRSALSLARCRYFRRLTAPGIPRWPRLYRSGDAYLIRCTRYLTPWRYFFASRLSAVAVWLAKFAFLALLVSFIPHPVIAQWCPAGLRVSLAAYIIAAVLLDRTSLHRKVGCWTIGATTDILITPTRVVVLRFLFVLFPWVRIYQREPELGLAAALEPHEQAAEDNASKEGRPIFAEASHLVLHLGHQTIRVATVFGTIHAERMARSFAALREELQKKRGIDKRKITHAAWAFGQAEPRAE